MNQGHEMNEKIKVGVYALTSCYGCQLMIATVSKIREIADAVDLISFHMLNSDSKMNEKVDIAVVEGSVSTEIDLIELKTIRENSKVLIALGACAINGGVQSWAEGEYNYEKLYNIVYGDNTIDVSGIQAQPIRKYVTVDHELPGCPPEEDEIVYFISTFLFGTRPEQKDYPVCRECRIEGNPCILIENKEPCLGPITTAGCRARCINFGVPCIGCRGPVPYDTAWFDSLAKIFRDNELSENEIRLRMSIFGIHNATFEKLLQKVFTGDDLSCQS